MASAAQADLVDRLGRDRVALGEAARRAAGFDPVGREGPVAVVRPATAEHVEHIVKIGRVRHLPVEVRGRLPALVPEDLRDAIVVDATGLGRPPAIDIGRRVVTVGAGVEAAAVDRAARQARLCLRGVPSLLAGETIGGLVGAGEPGELGLGDGSLLADVVGALVVTGGGRTLRAGGSDLLGQPPWTAEGAPSPLGLLVGGEGRMGVLIEVTLRLHRAPHAAWAGAELPAERPRLLAALSAARAVVSARLVDTVLVDETGGGLRVEVRVATWRGEDDLPAVSAAVQRTFADHGLALGAFVPEEKRVRLGVQPGHWPRPVAAPPGPSLDLRLAWPDVPAVLDVSDALYAEAAEPAQRSWALGTDFLRLRCGLGAEPQRPEQHPLVLRAHHLLDAGALPIGAGSRLRTALRERMPPAAKVLLTALARAWDPEGVLSPRTGIV